MLTRLTVRNFKRFGDVEIELGNPVVLIGPNNSGKTTALQALALWNIGVRLWMAKRGGKQAPEKRPGVTINRRDLIAMPVPDANLLWRDLHVRDVSRQSGKQETKGIRIEIIVEAVTNGKEWACGLEFDYANPESLYCRPLRTADARSAPRMPVPEDAQRVSVSFLPPMSGLLANETQLNEGAINVRIGEGRTAEVLRNLCHMIASGEDGDAQWEVLVHRIKSLFGVELDHPRLVVERGEIEMSYREPSGVRLDISSSGRGLQQTLLLLAHLQSHRGDVLLIDEPDAHLEILRQRQIYEVLSEAAREHGSQIVAASHSEVILNEAADRDVVVAFVGRPHRIDDRGSQVLKSLKSIGFDQYYQAEQNGWVLYLEGSTDLAILRAFADHLRHPVSAALERPFVKYVGNTVAQAREHFQGLREAKQDLVGIGVYDRQEEGIHSVVEPQEFFWPRREIENYLCHPDALIAFAEASAAEASEGPLFAEPERARRRDVMKECIRQFVLPVALGNPADRWWVDVKASDEFLDRVFQRYSEMLGLPNLMRKTDYHRLARYVPLDAVSPDVIAALGAIRGVADQARPAEQ
jgi:ABC-type thiamine transport system ATPase subunit